MTNANYKSIMSLQAWDTPQKRKEQVFMTANYDVEVKNSPKDHANYKYMVARLFDGELWYYGVFNELYRAREARDEIDGIILER